MTRAQKPQKRRSYGQRVYDLGVHTSNLGILGIGLGTKAGLTEGISQYLGHGGKHGGLATERVIRESLPPLPSLNPNRWKRGWQVMRKDAKRKKLWKACTLAAEKLGSNYKPPKPISGGGSILNSPTSFVRRNIFGNKHMAALADRVSQSRAGGIFRRAAKTTKRLKVSRWAPKLVRYGGAVGLGGLGITVAGMMMGGRPWRSNVESL